ncbi:hypothetical protein QJQ45_021682 [Haematococcus lacustris]|nr:hypothetical protein QJQ45_021682 [Haematococcus lacustris]
MAASMKQLQASRCSRRALVCHASTALPAQFKAVKPVGDRVFVKVDKAEVRSVGGVLLPSSATKKNTAGTVVALGEAATIKDGDRVLYSKYAGTEIAIGDDEHVLLKEEDVIGILGKHEKISGLAPMADRVLIKARTAKADTKTAGGVLLSSEAAEKPNFGTVVAVGPGKKKEDSDELIAPNVSVGQTVMYSKYSGTEFEEEDDEQYIVVRESDILAALS